MNSHIHASSLLDSYACSQYDAQLTENVFLIVILFYVGSWYAFSYKRQYHVIKGDKYVNDVKENCSEVARIREQIRLECEALERMQYGFAIVGTHQSILARYNRLGEHQQRLSQHIGEEAATRELIRTYMEIIG